MRAHELLTLVTVALANAACGSPDVGSAQRGPVLADVAEFDSAQMVSAGVAVKTVGLLPADTIHLTGTITFDGARVSHVASRIQGRIRRVYADIGTHVSRGDTLAVLDSPELGAAQARWTQARVSRDVARRNFDRAERLFRDGIVSERRRLEAEATLREQDAALTAALQMLSALGAAPDSSGSGLFVIRAPLNGEVVEKHATEGEVVGPEAGLFIVGELQRVWLLLDLYETDLRRVQLGMPVRVVADAYPQAPYFARVGLVSSIIDTISRTVKVRVEIPNEAHLLKPGMFARAGLALETAARIPGVPHAAVQTIGGRDAVFVPEGRGRFRARPVRLGPPRAGGWLEVLEGVRLGDSVVVSGAFALKTRLMQATSGEATPE